MNRSFAAAILWLTIGTASAQTTAPLVPPGAAGSGGSQPAPMRDSGIATTSPGAVIHPANPDPGMTVTPPAAGVTPVVPPPGTAGNNPAVVPK